jgi:hypothetical protein
MKNPEQSNSTEPATFGNAGLSAVFSVDKQIYFSNEKLPYKVMAKSKRYAVVVRKLNKREDAALLHHQVEMGAYSSFTEAFKDQNDCPVYSLIDFKENIKAPDNLIFPMINYFDRSECENVIKDLEKGKIELSKRNRVELSVDFARTLK